ncbi:ankyrin repeat, PH and SEC7 domain containing protein secG-like [Liolophura sinensis]|uniref:ankyrin repeat, PH and SEC7 domain containing protein secG-like n=1 Tax=Liolophura sinensis TaxID=3198878 RepID=UPI003158A8E5
MREQASFSGSLLDGRSVDVEAWTIPRVHKPCVSKPRLHLTEEYPRSLVSSGLGRATTVSQAIITGNLEALKELFKSGRAEHVDKRGNTALHIATKVGQVRALRWLLRHSHIPVMTRNKRGETCGHLAANLGQLKCLKAILAGHKEKHLGVVSERDSRGMTVLHHAVIGGSHRTVVWLVKEFGKDLCLMKNVDGAIALHIAAAKGATPMFYAAQEGHLECLRCLVHRGSGDISVSTNEGTTLLHIAALRGHVNILDYILLKLGNEALHVQSRDGSSLLHFAAGNGNDDVIRHLIKNPAFPEVLDLVDVNDSTPAHDAAEGGHVDCLKLLLDAGLELFTQDKEGETPYSLALRSTNPRCILFVRSLTEREYHSEGDILSPSASPHELPERNREDDRPATQPSTPPHGLIETSHEDRPTCHAAFRCQRGIVNTDHPVTHPSAPTHELPERNREDRPTCCPASAPPHGLLETNREDRRTFRPTSAPPHGMPERNWEDRHTVVV